MANKLPKADKITVSGLEDHFSTIVLSGSDPDGSVTGYSLSSLPSNGTLYLDAAHNILAASNTVYASKTFYFLPGSNFNGAASFNYNVVDNKGGVSASSASVTINVAAVNDAPVLDLNGAAGGTSATLTYSPGGSAARIAPSATVTDIDSSKFGGGSLRVSITQNKAVSDQLTISTDASVTISNGSVFVAGIKVGTVSGGSNGSDLVVSLVNGATPSSVSVLLEHVSYSNSLGSPPASPRTVTFSLVDGGGTANGGTDTGLATATINVGASNHAPTGAVSVAGTATEDEVLSASNTLADADGLGTISYHWQRDSGDGSGFVNIGGATNTTYTLGDADVGARVRVVAGYTDGHGMAESVVSAATAAIANVNDAPTGAVSVAGVATEDQALTASNTLADADGLGPISYQWQRDTGDGSSFVNIGGATNTTYTLGDTDVGAMLRVVAGYTDGHGMAEAVASSATAAIANVNDAPTGSVTVAGVATEDQVLTASNTLADADGLGTISYQWQRDSGDGSGFVNIGGATNTTYALGDADVGATVRVVASYTDGHGMAESLSSAATEVVAPVQEGYVVDGYISGATVFADTDGNGQLDLGEYSSVTDNFGHFVLQGGSGDLVVVGGTDTSTDQALIGKLTAPSGSAVVTPLTTLITLLVNDPASNLNVAGAEALVRGALGLATGIDLLTLDPVTAAFQNNADAFVAGISVLNTVSMVAATIAGVGGDQDGAATDVFSALANQILGLSTGEVLDLTNSSTIGAIADAAGNDALDADLLQALEDVVVASNQTLADDAATASTPAQLVTNATARAFVAQGSASDALAAAADDPGQIGTVVNSYTGVGLDAAVSSALNQIGNIAPAIQAHATLTEGADNLEPSILNTRVISTAPSLNPTDSIDLGGGYDVLALFGNGSFDLNGPSVLAGVDEVRLTYVNGSGPSALTLRDGMDVSVSVSGYGNETSIYLSSGDVSLDLDGINGGFYYLSSGTAIIDGSDSGFDDSSYYFSTGEATVSDANAGRNRYYLSSGTATIHAGGAYDYDSDHGYNYYYLANGSYALHGADANQDIFVLNNAAQLQTGSLIDGGTGSYNDDDGFTRPLQDTVAFNGSFDLTVPFSTVISNIEAYSIGGTLKVNQANLAGISSISGGTLTTGEAALDLSGLAVSSRIESSNADGTTFTVADVAAAFDVYGGEGNDTLIASGFTLSDNQRTVIFQNSSVETIIDASGTYVPPLQLTAGADTLAFGSSDLTNSTLNTTAPSLNPTDSIDLGGGYDVLALFGNGSFDLNGPSVLAGVDEVRLTYVNGSGPSALTLRDGMDVSVSVSGYGNETSIYLSSGDVSLDLDGINGGFYYLSSGTAIIDGSDSGFDDSSYYFSTGEATVSDANAGRNRYYLSSGTATIHAGGAYDYDSDHGYNYYYLANGSYALHGADANQDIFVLNNAAQLQTGSLIDGGTGSYNDDDGFTRPLQDTVAFNGSFDLTVPFSTVISNIEAYSIGGTLKVNQANLAGISSISGGTLTTGEAALDLSGLAVSSRIESSNADGTTFTVADVAAAFDVYGGEGNDTLIASGFTLSDNQRTVIFQNSSVETIIDASGTYVPPLQLTAGADTLAFGSSDLTNSTLNTTAPSLNPTDSIDLGGGYDVLALFGNGSFDLNGPSVLAGVDEVRLTYVNGSGPSALTLRDGMDVSVSVSGYGNETSIYLSSGDVSLDLDGINGGFYYLSSGTAIIDGSDSGFDDSSYYFSTGEATVSDANAGRNRYYLSSGTATIHAGGAYDYDSDHGYNYYYLANGSYALHGADANQDIFVLNNAAQLQTGSLIDGGTGSYNDDDGFTRPLQDTVAFNGTFDLTVPFSTVISNIEAYSIGGTLKVNQANLAGISSISGGTLTTGEAALDLSGLAVSSRIESSNAGGTTFTVADASTLSHVYGGDGNDTLIASGLTLSADQRDSIFLFKSVEAIRDDSGLYGNDQSNVLYAIANDTMTGQGGSDTFVFSAGFGNTVVTDFTPGSDIIRIPDELFATPQILDHATQQNADVVFDTLTGDTLRLFNVNLASLGSNDFDLV